MQPDSQMYVPNTMVINEDGRSQFSTDFKKREGYEKWKIIIIQFNSISRLLVQYFTLSFFRSIVCAMPIVDNS